MIYSLLIKALPKKIAHQAGYYFSNGRWHKLQDLKGKAPPSGSPISHHPEAGGKFSPASHFHDSKWESMKLDPKNVNAEKVNKKLDTLKELSDAGNVTGILGLNYGSNNYEAKVVKAANELLAMHGSPHQVTTSQKAGEHHAVAAPVAAVSAVVDTPPVTTTQPFGNADPYVYHNSSASVAQLKKGLKASKKGMEGDGVYFADSESKTLAYHNNSSALMLRVPKSFLVSGYGLYHHKNNPSGQVQQGDDILVGDKKTVIPPHVIEYKSADGSWLPVVASPSVKTPAHVDIAALEAAVKPSPKTPQPASSLPSDALLKLAYTATTKSSDNPDDKSLESIANAVHQLYKIKPSIGAIQSDGNNGVSSAISLSEPNSENQAKVLFFGSTAADGGVAALSSVVEQAKKQGVGSILAKPSETSLHSVYLDVGFDDAGDGLFKLDLKPHPKEGDTKPSADGGELVFHNGRWHSTDEPPPDDDEFDDDEQTATSIDISTLPASGAYKDYNHSLVAAKWKSLIKQGDFDAAYKSINKLAQSMKDKPSLQKDPDWIALLHHGADLANWMNATTKAALDAPVAVDPVGFPTKPSLGGADAIAADAWATLAKVGNAEALSNGVHAHTMAMHKDKALKNNKDAHALLDYGHSLVKWLMSKEDEPTPALQPKSTLLPPDATNLPHDSAYHELHNTEGKSNKFWKYAIADNKVYKTYGPIGSKGKSSVVEYPSNAAAVSAMLLERNAKSKKGYKTVQFPQTQPSEKVKDGLTDYKWTMDTDGLERVGASAINLHIGGEKVATIAASHNGQLYELYEGESNDPVISLPDMNDAQLEIGDYLKNKGLISYLGLSVLANLKEGLKPSSTALDLLTPKEGQTKEGVSGTLILKDGHWQKMTDDVPSIDGWTKVGGQLGSNAGGKFKDENGVEWYCKFPKNEDHAHSEVLASKLYKAAGVAGQDAKIITKDGKIGIASRWTNVSTLPSAHLSSADGTFSGFAVDAWLANWDVIGATNDNLQVDASGKAIRIDAGGALNYRAQVAKKQFTDNVSEIDSMLDPNINASAAAVFGKMAKADIAASVLKVLNVSNDDIKDLVAAHGGGSAADKQKLTDTLIARKNDLAAKFPVAAKKKEAVTPPPKPTPKFNIESLSLPPDFENWNNTGSGLSSHAEINKSNNEAVRAIYNAALKGDLDSIKNATTPIFNKDTKVFDNNALVSTHPSAWVTAYWQTLVTEVDLQLNPPTPPDTGPVVTAKSLEQISKKLPPVASGDAVAAIESHKKIGHYIVLGSVKGGGHQFMPETSNQVIGSDVWKNTAKAMYENASSAAKSTFNTYLSSSGANALNTALRTGNLSKIVSGKSLFNHVKGFKDLLVDIPKGATFTRSMGEKGYGQKPSPHLIKELQQFLLTADSGTILQEPAFSSTSWTGGSSVLSDNDILWEFTAGDGVKMYPAWLTANMGEGEGLLPPNQRYLIVSAQKVGKTVKVKAILLPTV